MVYLLHFDTPYKHARHYMGFVESNLERRVLQHRKGHAARLTQVLAEHNIGFQVARTWEGDRNYERRLKNQKNAPRLCPICQQQQRMAA